MYTNLDGASSNDVPNNHFQLPWYCIRYYMESIKRESAIESVIGWSGERESEPGLETKAKSRPSAAQLRSIFNVQGDRCAACVRACVFSYNPRWRCVRACCGAAIGVRCGPAKKHGRWLIPTRRCGHFVCCVRSDRGGWRRDARSAADLRDSARFFPCDYFLIIMSVIRNLKCVFHLIIYAHGRFI